jgi:ABC-type phosphate/phosphonate transport system substrate-binding protein
MNSGQFLSHRYKLLKGLSSGGMAQTYLAEDTQRPSNPQCVVKKLQPLSQDPKLLVIARTLFQREASVLEYLGEHDQIPRLLAHFEENQEFYLVEEFIEGHTIAAELQPGAPWSEVQVIRFLQEILPILEFIHGHNVIHRDIKPDNVMRRSRDGRLVLIDFGAVRQVQADLTASNPALASTIVGTYGYMPPEQAQGHPKLNSDLYALGMICIQAITGLHLTELPVDNQTGELEWTTFASVSPGLATLLSTMTRNQSQDRYPNATDALKALNDLKAQLQLSPAAPSSPPPSVPSSSTLQGFRKYFLPMGVGLVAVAGAVFGGTQLFGALSQKPQGDFGGDRILDIGVIRFLRPAGTTSGGEESKSASAGARVEGQGDKPNTSSAYDDLSNYFTTKLQARLGKNVSVKLHLIDAADDQALERAKQEIKAQRWELAFTGSPMLSATAVANQYQFAARMAPNRTQNESALFVRNDSPIKSLDDLTADKTIALADFSSAPGFYMPVYDLFGKTLRVDMNNNNRESMAKVRSGQVDVGVGNYGASLKKATDLRILHVSRGIPLAGVYIAPKLTSQDQKLVTELLLAAPATVQNNARYAAGSPIDYSEFLKVVKRVEEITSCANWKVNPVKFYCGNGSGNTSSNTSNHSGIPVASTGDSIVGTTGGYSAYDNRVEFTLQGAERKVYRLILPRTVIDRDPDLDSPTALNFKKVTIKGVQPVEVNGVLELRVTAAGQVKVVNAE